MRNGVSLSTLGRYIKSGKVQFKSENGKYLILSKESASSDWLVSNLEAELKKAQEEISELKMLVAVYEERLFQNPSPQL